MSSERPPLPPEDFDPLLKTPATAFGFGLSPAARASLSRYLSELDLWRRRTNLTGKLSQQDLADHALESAIGETLVPHGARVVDIGSGAGFPGVPLAIVRPDLLVCALEPRKKRVEFLRHIARAVPVSNLEVLEGRPSDLPPRRFDVAVSRAVGDLADVIGKADFLKPAGLLLAWTTDPEGLARALSSGFSQGPMIAVPGARRKVIAAFRARG
jgi:16S rRNA (guanine527-N7)-methyltransferase